MIAGHSPSFHGVLNGSAASPILAALGDLPPSNGEKLVGEAFNPNPERFLIVDGLNVIYGNQQSPRLETLLTLLADLASNGYDFGCIFDANTRYVLSASQTCEHVRVYEALLAHHKHFIEVNGVRADDIILAEADARAARVISNDHYKGYRNDYPWLTAEGKVIRVNTVRDFVHVGKQRLHIEGCLDRAFENLLVSLRGTGDC